ncbi:hypothetical protein [Fusicatenibacter sp.]
MEDLIGVYGILDRDHWPEAPFQLLDGGVEIRWKEPYAFHNAERGTYSGRKPVFPMETILEKFSVIIWEFHHCRTGKNGRTVPSEI